MPLKRLKTSERWRRLRAPFTNSLYVLITAALVTGGVLGMRHLGWLQSLELLVYDQMVRLQPARSPDTRLLLVTITEADIRTLIKRWPPSDQLLAETLTILQRDRPAAIGLDLIRDVPHEPGHQALINALRQPNVIAAFSIGNTATERTAPPPGVPATQVGFIDLVLDPDNRVRRSLLFATPEDATYTAFALQLSTLYLDQQHGITAQITPTREYQLGNVVFPQLPATAGGYRAIDAAGYQKLLRYRPAQPLALQVSLSQVLAGAVPPEQIRDKIVLIGVSAPSLKDSFLTPYSNARRDQRLMPGVVIHGHIVSQILAAVLDGQPLLWFPPEGVEVLLIGLGSVLGALLAWWRRVLWVPISVGLVVLGLALSSYGLFLRQGWVPMVAPMLAVVLSSSAETARRGYQSQRKRKLMMRLLGQQTSPEIAEALWGERDRLLSAGLLPWQTLTATILFTDLRNFSTLAEAIPSEVLMPWLNYYLGAMTELVQRHHGIVNKFTGDGLIAVFGVPVARTTPAEIAADAQAAIATAQAMAQLLQRLNRTHPLPTGQAVQMRVGIYTGTVTVGSLGSKHRLEYGVIGDSVNIAARLESYDKTRQPDDCRILIARETLDHLGPTVAVEPWGSLTLKGKHHTIEVYRVLSSTTDSPPNPSAPPPTSTR